MEFTYLALATILLCFIKLIQFKKDLYNAVEKCYREYFKRFYFIKKSVDYAFLLGSKDNIQNKCKIFYICSKKEIIDNYNEKKLSEEDITIVKEPKFYRKTKYNAKYVSKKLHVISPDVRLNLYYKKYFFGKSNFIGDDKKLYLDNYIKNDEVLAAHNDRMLKSVGSLHKLSFHCNKRIIDKGILLTGQCSGNYAHWITEILPKIPFLDKFSEFDEYPFILDNWHQPIFEESVQLASSKIRKIIYINPYERVFAKNLVDITCPSYIPVKTDLSRTEISPYLFSKESLIQLRTKIINKTGCNNNHSDLKKLFLIRSPQYTGNHRFLINNNEIQEIASRHGYFAIDPASLDFKKQVKLFMNATQIISPIGAALSNLVFTSRSCDVLILSPDFKNADFRFFSSLLGMLNHNVTYLLGEQVYSKNRSFDNHDYFISNELFQSALNSMN